jgi:hypothetical protein
MSTHEESVRELLHEMLAPDGYDAIIHEWPEGDFGRVRIEIVAGEDVCEDCLVPKTVLASVISTRLPPGLEVTAADLRYPADAH